MSRRAHEISEKLNGLGIDSLIGSTHEISVESDKKILEHIKKAKKVLIIEDHYEFGGIGTRINELVSSNQLNIPVVVRLEGTNAQAGAKLLNQSNVNVIAANSLDDAAQKIVAALKG